MKKATVRELRNRYTTLLDWIDSGEQVEVTRRGKVIARLVPDDSKSAAKVDWTKSRAYLRNRKGEPVLSAKQTKSILDENKGNW